MVKYVEVSVKKENGKEQIVSSRCYLEEIFFFMMSFDHLKTAIPDPFLHIGPVFKVLQIQQIQLNKLIQWA